MPLPYQKSTIVAVFVRIAKQQANPADSLLAILQGNFTTVTTGDATTLTSTTTGGSSANWVLPPGMSRMDIMEITELALRNIETGIDDPITCDPISGAPLAPHIKQIPASQRIISYGQFGGIHR